MMFIPIDAPKNPDYDDPKSYGVDGALNIYITVADYHNNATLTKIGAWLILPESEKALVTSGDVASIMRNTQYDVVVYMHGVACNRAKRTDSYAVIRKHFLVIAVDHRGYGDSGTNVEQTEPGIAHDTLQIYDWIKGMNFPNDIYIWGHSLGTSLSTHTVKLIKTQRNEAPKGLILESAFTTMREVVKTTVFGRLFGWLAYFNATVLYPIDYNGFHFYSSSYILDVDCPIMLMHAEDDTVVPSYMGETMYHIASTQRDMSYQGNVTFHLFLTQHGYGHNDVTQDSRVPQFIEDFKATCRNFTIS